MIKNINLNQCIRQIELSFMDRAKLYKSFT